jgi:hypothetical protein
LESPGQQTTLRRREKRWGDFRKADFRLRFRAGLAVPNRVGISPISNQWSCFAGNVRIRTAIESAFMQSRTGESLEGCWRDSN